MLDSEIRKYFIDSLYEFKRDLPNIYTESVKIISVEIVLIEQLKKDYLDLEIFDREYVYNLLIHSKQLIRKFSKIKSF